MRATVKLWMTLIAMLVLIAAIATTGLIKDRDRLAHYYDKPNMITKVLHHYHKPVAFRTIMID